jgi:hypothetical protein|tara:strand:+ start:429 stop:1484 length:1056 start_codon:yes stop_codon:yes gene_type:complete
MKKILLIFLLVPCLIFGQTLKETIKKTFKFSTFYAAVNGGNSLSDVNTFSVNTGQLVSGVTETPFDYSINLGVRKIARFQYENRANVFYNGTENTYSDAANVGKIKGFEFLFEGDLRRVQGKNYVDQHHFLRYVADDWIAKVEYLQDGFADIKFFEASQRYKYNISNKFSVNVGAAQRLAEPYGYDPLAEWLLNNGNIHYTYLAIQEGYTVDFSDPNMITYSNPSGNIVATNTEVWEALIIPEVLSNYDERKRNEQGYKMEYSMVLGFDYYHYSKEFWIHTWGNVMPYHVNTNNEYSYHNYQGGQWVDYSGGLIFGHKFNKHLGVFAEGKYNKYWNRKWHNFSIGVNYVIF